jgi:hypothetical protein
MAAGGTFEDESSLLFHTRQYSRRAGKIQQRRAAACHKKITFFLKFLLKFLESDLSL